MRAMVRSILVTEIFQKATRTRIGSDDDGSALTLMSTDIERISMGLLSLHEIWAGIIQVPLATWMLYEQLGVVFVAPMGIVCLCSIGLAFLMRFAGDSQKAWMAGVQKRVGLTATVISNMKNLKLSGLSYIVGEFLQKLRVEELASGARFRRVSIVAALLGFTPMFIGPPLTFAFAQRTLDVSRIFTSLSWLLLLTTPLIQVFQAVPPLLSALACLSRIQVFLQSEDRNDFREVLDITRKDTTEKALESTSCESNSERSCAITIRDGQFGWKADTIVLKRVNTQIYTSGLTIVVGPVGSGKSTLCKALLGEIPFQDGTITLSNAFRHVGFCDQTAFLSNGSIRENIVGFFEFDSDRYSEVIHATLLDYDLDMLPQGDRTNVGSDGITLSGGQKQRVSLARALYSRTDLLILDDVFSGLDADTEDQVFRQVFGPDGLLKRRATTVVLCTHSVKHLPSADYIIVLGEGSISEQGSYVELVSQHGYVRNLGLNDCSDRNSSSRDSISEKSVPKSATQILHKIVTKELIVESTADASRQAGDKKVYRHYLQSMGWLSAAGCLVSAVFLGFFSNFPTICESIISSTVF